MSTAMPAARDTPVIYIVAESIDAARFEGEVKADEANATTLETGAQRNIVEIHDER